MSKGKQINGRWFIFDCSKIIMKTFINISIIICCSILIISCGNGLSRSKAERLIDGSPKFSEVKINTPLNRGGFEKGIHQGKWNTQGHLTSRGQNDFKRIEHGFIELVKPLDVVIEVTGITDMMEDVKAVMFAWTYKNIPSTVKRFIVEGGTGTAYFRKYDDGWRIEETTIGFSEVAVKQEPKEIEQEQKEEALIRQEAERMQAVLQKSKTRTKILSQYEFSSPTAIGSVLYVTMEVSDVDLVVKEVDRDSYGGYTKGSKSYWFGQIDNVQISDDNKPICRHKILVNMKTSDGKYYGPAWCSSERSTLDELSSVISSAVAGWRTNNSEVVQKNLH